ncbi:MAG: caspase family protein [Muribaculaceae bacterium]|nr:caspase family protein [Muribaculaceae bacterium]
MIASANTHTLIAAINHYDRCPNGSAQSALSFSISEAKKMKKFMSKNKRSQTVTLLADEHATHDGILGQLTKLCGEAQNGDRIFFFFMGHGAGNGSFCAWDKDFSTMQMMKIFATSKASQIFVFIDACYSGSAEQQYRLFEQYNDINPQVVFFASSAANERSWVDSENSINVNNYFTRGVSNALHGACDKNQDRAVTIEELYNYVFQYVTERSEGIQHPKLVTSAKNNNNSIVISW